MTIQAVLITKDNGDQGGITPIAKSDLGPQDKGFWEELRNGSRVSFPTYSKNNGKYVIPALKSDYPLQVFRFDLGDEPDGDYCKAVTETQQGDEYYYVIDLDNTYHGAIQIQIGETDDFMIRLEAVPKMGKEDYNQIVADLLRTSRNLMYLLRNKNAAWRIREGIITERQVTFTRLEESFNTLNSFIDELLREPETDVAAFPIKTPFHKIKLFNERILIERYVQKQPKVHIDERRQSYDIYENRKLKSFLINLKEQYDQLLAGSEPAADEKAVVGEVTDRGDLENQIQARITRLQEILRHEMFSDLPKTDEPLHSTNLLVNHPYYSKAFYWMKRDYEIDELFNKFPSYEKQFRISELYELWCYFKILELLTVHYGYEPIRYLPPLNEAEIKSAEGEKEIYAVKKGDWRTIDDKNRAETVLQTILRTYLDSEDEREEHDLWSLTFKLTNTEDGKEWPTVYLGYNYTVEVDDEHRYIRPDILMIVNDTIYTCDAKYRDYETQGLDQWNEDIFGCAAFKYLFRLGRHTGIDAIEKELKVGAACIVSSGDFPYENGIIEPRQSQYGAIIINDIILNDLFESREITAWMETKREKEDRINDVIREEIKRREGPNMHNKEFGSRLAFIPFLPGERSEIAFRRVFGQIIEGNNKYFI